MQDITGFADKHNLPMSLTTGSRDPQHGTTSASRLKRFYKQFGFVENKGRWPEVSDNMVRPKKSQRKQVDNIFANQPPLADSSTKAYKSTDVTTKIATNRINHDAAAQTLRDRKNSSPHDAEGPSDRPRPEGQDDCSHCQAEASQGLDEEPASQSVPQSRQGASLKFNTMLGRFFARYREDQARVPAGSPEGGQFGSGTGASTPLTDWSKARPADPTKHEIPADPDYLYHGTNLDGFYGIADDKKLKTFGPSYGTDQNEWPDGSRSKRSYWSPSPAVVKSFYPAEGQPVLLRARRSDLNAKRESTGDWYVEKPVGINKLQYFNKAGGWSGEDEGVKRL